MPDAREALRTISAALDAQYEAIVSLNDPRDVRLTNAARFLCDAIDLVDAAAQEPIGADNDNAVLA